MALYENLPPTLVRPTAPQAPTIRTPYLYKSGFPTRPAENYLFDYNDPYEENSLLDVFANSFDSGNFLGHLAGGSFDLFKRATLDPLRAGHYGTAALNNLMGFAETLDIVAAPTKALLQGRGLDDAKKAWGIGTAGRYNYDWDTGNIISDIMLEVVSDPINWVTLGMKGVVTSTSKTALKGALKEAGALAKISDEAIYNKMAKQLVKAYLKEDTEELAKQATRLYNSFEKTGKVVMNKGNTVQDMVKVLQKAEAVAKESPGYTINKSMYKLVGGVENFERVLFRAAFTPSGLYPASWVMKQGYTRGSRMINKRIQKSMETYARPDGGYSFSVFTKMMATLRDVNDVFGKLTEIKNGAMDIPKEIVYGIQKGLKNDVTNLAEIMKGSSNDLVEMEKSIQEYMLKMNGTNTLEEYASIVADANLAMRGDFQWAADELQAIIAHKDMLVELENLRFATVEAKRTKEYLSDTFVRNAQELDALVSPRVLNHVMNSKGLIKELRQFVAEVRTPKRQQLTTKGQREVARDFMVRIDVVYFSKIKEGLERYISELPQGLQASARQVYMRDLQSFRGDILGQVEHYLHRYSEAIKKHTGFTEDFQIKVFDTVEESPFKKAHAQMTATIKLMDKSVADMQTKIADYESAQTFKSLLNDPGDMKKVAAALDGLLKSRYAVEKYSQDRIVPNVKRVVLEHNKIKGLIKKFLQSQKLDLEDMGDSYSQDLITRFLTVKLIVKDPLNPSVKKLNPEYIEVFDQMSRWLSKQQQELQTEVREMQRHANTEGKLADKELFDREQEAFTAGETPVYKTEAELQMASEVNYSRWYNIALKLQEKFSNKVAFLDVPWVTAKLLNKDLTYQEWSQNMTKSLSKAQRTLGKNYEADVEELRAIMLDDMRIETQRSLLATTGPKTGALAPDPAHDNIPPLIPKHIQRKLAEELQKDAQETLASLRSLTSKMESISPPRISDVVLDMTQSSKIVALKMESSHIQLLLTVLGKVGSFLKAVQSPETPIGNFTQTMKSLENYPGGVPEGQQAMYQAAVDILHMAELNNVYEDTLAKLLGNPSIMTQNYQSAFVSTLQSMKFQKMSPVYFAENTFALDEFFEQMELNMRSLYDDSRYNLESIRATLDDWGSALDPGAKAKLMQDAHTADADAYTLAVYMMTAHKADIQRRIDAGEHVSFIDIETTGLHSNPGEILEIGVSTPGGQTVVFTRNLTQGEADRIGDDLLEALFGHLPATDRRAAFETRYVRAGAPVSEADIITRYFEEVTGSMPGVPVRQKSTIFAHNGAGFDYDFITRRAQSSNIDIKIPPEYLNAEKVDTMKMITKSKEAVSLTDKAKLLISQTLQDHGTKMYNLNCGSMINNGSGVILNQLRSITSELDSRLLDPKLTGDEFDEAMVMRSQIDQARQEIQEVLMMASRQNKNFNHTLLADPFSGTTTQTRQAVVDELSVLYNISTADVVKRFGYNAEAVRIIKDIYKDSPDLEVMFGIPAKSSDEEIMEAVYKAFGDNINLPRLLAMGTQRGDVAYRILSNTDITRKYFKIDDTVPAKMATALYQMSKNLEDEYASVRNTNLINELSGRVQASVDSIRQSDVFDGTQTGRDIFTRMNLDSKDPILQFLLFKRLVKQYLLPQTEALVKKAQDFLRQNEKLYGKGVPGLDDTYNNYVKILEDNTLVNPTEDLTKIYTDYKEKNKEFRQHTTYTKDKNVIYKGEYVEQLVRGAVPWPKDVDNELFETILDPKRVYSRSVYGQSATVDEVATRRGATELLESPGNLIDAVEQLDMRIYNLEDLSRDLDNELYSSKMYAVAHALKPMAKVMRILQKATKLEQTRAGEKLHTMKNEQGLQQVNNLLHDSLLDPRHLLSTLVWDSPIMRYSIRNIDKNADIILRTQELLLRAADFEAMGIHFLQGHDIFYIYLKDAATQIKELKLKEKYKKHNISRTYNGQEIPLPQHRELIQPAGFEIGLGVDALMAESRTALHTLSRGRSVGSTGELMTPQRFNNYYLRMPKEIQDDVGDIYALIDDTMWQGLKYDWFNLGTVEVKRGLDPFTYKTALDSLRNALEYSAALTETKALYLDMYFNSQTSINVGKMAIDGLNMADANATDQAIIDSLKNSTEFILAALVKSDSPAGDGYRVVQLNVKTLEDMAEARRLNATILPYQVFATSHQTLNTSQFSSTFLNVWHKIIYTYKIGYLLDPGVIMRNYVDSLAKNIVSDDGNVREVARYQARSMRLLNKYNIALQDILKLGQHKFTHENLHRFFDLVNTDKDFTMEQFKFIHGFIAYSASAGMTGPWQKYLKDQNFASEEANLWSSFVAFSDMLMTPNKWTEQINRLTQYMLLEGQGHTKTQIFKRIAETHFDYNIKTQTEMYAELIFPFYTFTMRNLEYWVNAMTQRPWLANMFKDIMTPVWNFDGYSQDELGRNRSLQYQLLAGNVAPFADNSMTLKLNPSYMDVYNLISDIPNSVLAQVLAGEPLPTAFASISGKMAAPLQVAMDQGWEVQGGLAAGLFDLSAVAGEDTLWNLMLNTLPVLGAAKVRYEQGGKYAERSGFDWQKMPLTQGTFGATQRWDPPKPKTKKVSNFYTNQYYESDTSSGYNYNNYHRQYYPSNSQSRAGKLYYKSFYKDHYTKKGVSKLKLRMMPYTKENLIWRIKDLYWYLK